MRGRRARLPRDRVGIVLTAVWAAGHVAVAALLAEAGTSADMDMPDRTVTSPDHSTLTDSAEGDRL